MMTTRMTRTMLLVTTLALLTLMLAGCGGGGKIEGVTWKLTAYAAEDGTMTDAIADATDASFGEGTVSGNGGVNSYSAQYTLDGDSIEIQPVASTLMAGSDDLMTQETAFFAALDAATTYKVSGTKLTISGPDGDLLEFQSAE